MSPAARKLDPGLSLAGQRFYYVFSCPESKKKPL